MFSKRKKLRKEFDQRLLQLMEKTQKDWLSLAELERLSYEKNEELQLQTLLAKAKYFFLFSEAKRRRISKK